MLLSNPQLLKWAKALINRHDYEVATRDLGDDYEIRKQALERYDQEICQYGPVMTENLSSRYQFFKPPTIDTPYPKGGPRKKTDAPIYKLPDPTREKPMAVITESDLHLLPELGRTFVAKERLDDLYTLCNRIRKKVRQQHGPRFIVYFDNHNDEQGVTIEPLETTQ